MSSSNSNASTYHLPSLAEKRTLLASAEAIANYSLCSAGAGATVGALLAKFRGQSSVAWAFSMGSNWLLLSVPFFTVREGIMFYRHERNRITGRNNLVMRDKDEFIATTISGTLMGGFLGQVWRGPRGIPAGMLTYGFLASAGQVSFTLFRRLRQDAALRNRAVVEQEKLAMSTSTMDETGTKKSSLPSWYTDPFRSDGGAPPVESTLDPIQDAFLWLRGKLFGKEEVPSWASPLANAFDLDYRIKLNNKVTSLEIQVEDLKLELSKLERTEANQRKRDNK
ncbi:hypothetical protein HDU76_007271 [Blyttiomyces sp. JEL0837]|nr:hypothetical protein HDU76_007271 [Blyttiomyces sp. JEL0837]